MNFFDILGIFYILTGLLICAGISLVIYLYYAHPKDGNYAGVWFIRPLIIASATLILFTIWLVPFDALANYEK